MTAPRVETAPPVDLDHLDLDGFAGRRVAVLGLARSGLALARFLHDRGAEVTAYDVRSLAELSEAVAALEGRPIRLLVGPEVDPAEVVRGQSLVTTSPAVSSRYPTTEPRLRTVLAALEAAGQIPVVSEVDLFLRLCPAVTVGVTGTKGKTTTASLCAAVLEAGDRPVILGGNIGTPLVERLPELTPEHRVVLELSELQLPTLSRGTDVAVYTHVTEDHLDRHGSVEAYRAVKARLAKLTRERGGVLVLNEDDPFVSALEHDYLAQTGFWDGKPGSPGWPGLPITRYRLGGMSAGGVGVVEGWIVADGIGRVMPVDELRIPGRHNLSNALAAVSVGLIFGVMPEAIRGAVAGFPGVPHRLETVAVVDGVRYVNDSQGTQPDAVIAALRSFPRPLVLIAGGKDKGVPVDALAREAVAGSDAVVLIGENAGALESAFRAAGHGAVERATTLEAAVRRAAEVAANLRGRAGAEVTVLLSPGAASFDMFADYAARGDAFKAAVARLAAAGGGR